MSEKPYAKHSTHTDALATLGTIIGPDEGRDAIHLAVFNAVASCYMIPGTHVVLDETKTTALPAPPGKGVGIVDPFLLSPVEEGQRFWLIVYPRQITSLRHVWEHPAFPEGNTQGKEDVPCSHGGYAFITKEQAEDWLRDFCDHADCPGFDAVITAAQNNDHSWDKDYLHIDGMDAHGEIPPEFWDYMEVYLGRKFGPSERPSYFSCSC